ncbi:LysR family transcriptional regulator [Microbacterium aquimaris]|uniref:LysR family transcriptional regulator n=1 Tax=Microbacterium aquimaris TaxID=459816 RepID=A0ABU5N512_9MICO|nr:LysR family transcriptional regulator [Microbacterium aquimaris]MDZ8161177.1 LysR family transcriptional regulator [Microbacterium aquimaris]
MTPASLDTDTLRLLAAIDEHGSVGAGALACGWSQQAASARIRRAERTVERDLLVRRASGSILTADAVLIVEWARPLLDAEAVFRVSLDALTRTDAAVATIAASQTVSEAYLPAWLTAARATLPATHWRLVSDNSEGVLDRVRSGEAEVGVIESPHPPGGVNASAIGTDRLAMVCNPDHPWATSGRTVSVEEVATEPLAVREPGSGTRATLEHALARHGHEATRPAAELSSTGALRAALRAGIAPGVVSPTLIADDLAGGLLREVATTLELTRPLTAVWRGLLSPHARRFLTLAASDAHNRPVTDS